MADLRRFYKKHAKSARIDARVLARLPLVNPEALHPLQLPSAMQHAWQRFCKQQDHLAELITAAKNRILALDSFAFPGLETVLNATFGKAARRFRQAWYDPWRLQKADPSAIAGDLDLEEDQARQLRSIAKRAIALYGTPEGGPAPYLDYADLQAEVLREQRVLTTLEEEHHDIRTTTRKRYRQIHPKRFLETLKGVGQDGAAVYASFIGDPKRFPNHRQFRGWSGMIPASNQSADSARKGLHITQAGPDLVKKYAYLNGEVARQWDPQIAAIYYDQMVHKGKHHNQAVCACATHLLDRVYVVLKEDRPYTLRDLDGTPVTVHQARAIIAQRYHVPEEVRRRNNHRARKARAKRQAERKERRNRPGN